MNRRPVAISWDSIRAIVLCSDGSVFERNTSDESNDWMEHPPIPGTVAAGEPEEPNLAEAALEVMRAAEKKINEPTYVVATGVHGRSLT